MNEVEIQTETETFYPPRKHDFSISFGMLLGFVVTFLSLGVVSGIVIGITNSLIDLDIILIATGFYGLLLDALMFIIAILLFKKVRQFSFAKFDFAPMKLGKTYLYLVVSFILLFISQYLFIGLLQMDDSSQQYDTLGGNLVGDHWINYLLFYFALVVITPIKEELLFRGLFLRFFEEKYNFWIGLILSALIFGLLHVDYPLSAITMGAILGGLYKKTNSIVPPTILHMSWNLIAAMTII